MSNPSVNVPSSVGTSAVVNPTSVGTTAAATSAAKTTTSSGISGTTSSNVTVSSLSVSADPNAATSAAIPTLDPSIFSDLSPSVAGLALLVISSNANDQRINMLKETINLLTEDIQFKENNQAQSEQALLAELAQTASGATYSNLNDWVDQSVAGPVLSDTNSTTPMSSSGEAMIAAAMLAADQQAQSDGDLSPGESFTEKLTCAASALGLNPTDPTTGQAIQNALVTIQFSVTDVGTSSSANASLMGTGLALTLENVSTSSGSGSALASMQSVVSGAGNPNDSTTTSLTNIQSEVNADQAAATQNQQAQEAESELSQLEGMTLAQEEAALASAQAELSQLEQGQQAESTQYKSSQKTMSHGERTAVNLDVDVMQASRTNNATQSVGGPPSQGPTAPKGNRLSTDDTVIASLNAMPRGATTKIVNDTLSNLGSVFASAKGSVQGANENMQYVSSQMSRHSL